GDDGASAAGKHARGERAGSAGVTAVGQPPASQNVGTLLCPRCGTALREDQSWCLECGLAARTRVHPPPGWRLPIALTAVLLALLAAGIAVALVTLLDTPESAPPPATVTMPASTPPATPAPATTSPAATTPTTISPGATTPTATTPSGTSTQGTFTIPGTRITLPATGGARGAGAIR
ncbi:MAG TPA: hypothetical protein VFS37_07295, partial [Conexibacter sp.]|nr:hypothetical protein [Conexibacter sp.]